MKYTYYTKEGKFETYKFGDIPIKELYYPNENTPAIIYPTGRKEWCFKGKYHRLTGPSRIWKYSEEEYWLNGHYYQFKDWIHNHPNINIYLEAIGHKTNAQKALWKLKNL